MSEEQIRQARALLTRPDESVSSIARLLGVSRTTLYKYLPELVGSAVEPSGAFPAELNHALGG
jgi:transposase-like protein